MHAKTNKREVAKKMKREREVEMPRAEYVREHRRLTALLRTGSAVARRAEAKKQSAEAKEKLSAKED